MEGMQQVLEDIRDLLAPKENFSIVVTSSGTDWTTHLSLPLFLNPKRRYELALVNLEAYNSLPNITEANNHFVYSPNGTTWKTITLPEGSYELVQINTEIQRQLEANGDWKSSKNTHYITVGANPSTLRTFIKIDSTAYQVDMASSTIRPTVGFNPQTLTSGYHEGENPVNILSVNTILVNCDIISGSFLSGNHATRCLFILSRCLTRLQGYRVTE